ncbi:MAG TPA: PmoA family protein [Blastocatellia bacterium]|nr:PmoA family protein [Blastocatellia bacterium]
MRKIHAAFFAALCLGLAVCPVETGAARKAAYVTVAAGPFDRRETVVSFTMPGGLKASLYRLRDESGRLLPLQVDAGRQATFVLPELKANTVKRFRLEAWKPGAAVQGVETVREGNKLILRTAGRQALAYQSQGELPRADIKPIFRRGGYLHPVYTPSGRVVTDDYPPKHLHHHGIWFAWTKTEFGGRKPDFWNMGEGTGAVEFVALAGTWSGPVHGGFQARHRYVDLSGPEPQTVLNEVWEVLAYGVGHKELTFPGAKPYSMFDLVSTQTCAAATPLVLPEYHYGGMGFRGHRQWDGKENTFFLTSEGKDRSNGHGTRARWCHIGGRVDGQLVGIAILGHPDNFRAPQPMRIHPDEPFFCFAPSQMGRWEIAPGKPYISRYRYVVTDGPPDRAELERLWNDYANPPEVTISHR